MKTFISAILFFILVSPLVSNSQNTGNDLPNSNPFKYVSTLPYRAPVFDKIKDADYKPAIEEGIKQQLAEIENIANNPAPPTFENTIIAMEKSGELLQRVSAVFGMVAGANTNSFLQQVRQQMAPKLSALRDAVNLNPKLFKRIETLYNNRSTLKLDAEGKKLIENYYQQFVLAGARVADADKETLKKLNTEEATLTTRFANMIINAGKAGAVIINDVSELAGLPQSDIDAFAQNAKARGLTGKWVIPLQNTTQQPALQSLSVRATRQKLFEASWNRAEHNDSNDTRQVVSRLAEIRALKAKIMGFKNYAKWKLMDRMAQSPEVVDKFFAKVVPSVAAKTKQEAADIQALIDKQHGGFKLEPWDWDYYSEQVRKEKYDLDDNETKPYFEISKVLENGVFYAANQLYGITFKERKDIPVYQEDVRVFEVFDKDQRSMALFYCDYFKRDNKNGGAWCSSIVSQSKLLGTKPTVYNVCNFTKPAPGQPTLISFTNVITMFHEFGHALHAMFTNLTYPSLAGNVARDFVEFPSQFNEHWALDPIILKHYAVHYKTGEPIPQKLIDKIKKAGDFNSGYATTEAMAGSLLDMQWHKLAPSSMVKDVDQFEKDALLTTGLYLPQAPPRYRSTYFSHIWAGGYAAGYYSYQWTKMISEDAYAWFEKNGGLTRANGQRFRDMVLSRGSSLDYNTMYKSFTGSAPDIKAYQKALGLPY
ncbi:MAG: peptidyl-dipeptidase Dcp [Chitinophagaceae bacterium]|nr:peptidyl-dipeptidase Dcp [Chitinophagaceae bacterium]